MNQMIKDFREGTISYEDLINPEIIAKYALDDHKFLNWLRRISLVLSDEVEKLHTSPRKKNIKFQIRIYKQALEIVYVNLRLRG